MQHRHLEKIFSSFIVTNKGYPSTALLPEALIPQSDDKLPSKRYIADLLILDLEYKNYLALVEFKTKNDVTTMRGAFQQVKAYLNLLDKPDLPVFLVTAHNEEDFQIYNLIEDTWHTIDKNDFPEYQTLQSKSQADSKNLSENLSAITTREIKRKKELFKSTAWATLTSLIAGIITVVIFSIETFNKTENKDSTITNCCDSTTLKIEELETTLGKLEQKLTAIQKNDTLGNNFASDANGKIMEKLRNFDSILTINPERVLRFQEINFQLKELQNSIAHEREKSEIKEANLKDKLDQVVIWTSGLIITIIGSIIGFAVNAFRKA